MFDARNNTKRTEVLGLVNTIRARVDAWREAGWPGVTIVTRKLLEHWHDREARQLPFYFCQLEAIETLIWLAGRARIDDWGSRPQAELHIDDAAWVD